ncbi:MAG: hypothetical protein J6Z45_00530 [Oscillospiraceae bacterium]|nr:hypothetical protein [Oscillospiraceae bacterium]
MSQNKKPKNPGANRQQRRNYDRNPQQRTSSKPKGMRILAIILFAFIVLGMVLVPIFVR